MIKSIREANNTITINKSKIDAMKELFPGCFNGRDFDAEALRHELADEVVFTNGGCRLDFLGKAYSKYITELDTESFIEPDISHNLETENKNSQNVYISGDNLDALKHLQKAYKGKIKVIYIDPLYNTGSDGFGYNDRFGLTPDILENKIGLSEREANRVYSLTSTHASTHSAWLTSMYPRLYLARQLLSDDGLIFISIDDFEQENLKKLCCEIFGERAFVNQIVRRRTDNQTNNGGVARVKEYVLCFAKNPENSYGYNFENDFWGIEYGTNQRSNDEIEDLFGFRCFEFPKPTSLIKELLNLVDTRDSYILDFYSGSATTADAIMQLNAADNGGRKYIMVQSQEKCKVDPEAKQHEYDTIDQIGQSRIEKAAGKIKNQTGANIDYGFKHYTLNETPDEVCDALYKFNSEALVVANNIYEQYGIESILETLMVRDGFKFTDSVFEIDLNGYTAYRCGNCIYFIVPDNNHALKDIKDAYINNKAAWDKLVLFGYSFTHNEVENLEGFAKDTGIEFSVIF